MGPWGPISHSVRSVCALSAKDTICISAHLCSSGPNLALIFSLKVQCVKSFREAQYRFTTSHGLHITK